MTDKLEIVVPAGTGGAGDYALSITPERAGWAHSSLNVLELAAGGTHTFDTGESEWVVLPLSGSCTVACDGRDVRPRRAPRRLHPRHRLRLRPPRRHRHGDLRAGRAVRALRGPRQPAADRPLRPRRGRAGRAPRGGTGQPAGQQLLHPGVVRGRQDDRRRGHHPGRQLVVVPAAQARRGGRERVAAGGGLLLRGRLPVPGRPRRCLRLPAGVRLRPGQGDRRLRRGPLGRRDPHPLRLARPGDGRARLRPLLPQRHGRPGPRAGLEDLRRPGARLGPHPLGRPGDRPAPAADQHCRNSTTEKEEVR